jgi:cyclopropane-fatty-acyl-phospholipid synthase
VNTIKSNDMALSLGGEVAAPRSSLAKTLLQRLLARADVRIDGDRPWDLKVKDPRLFWRLLLHGSLGLGESYMDGWWECQRIDELIRRLLKADLDRGLYSPREVIDLLLARCMNMQSRSRAWIVGERHYDIGDDLYRAMLDSTMSYSCAYWKDATDLDAAQEAKLDLIARKLRLSPGMRVLDIGCGWGGAARYLAERYSVTITGVTISNNQAATARERCHGLPVDIRLQDYREVRGKFDRIYSIGMFEHVGYKNHRPYMRIVRELLAEDGLFLLHTIGSGSSRKVVRTDPWMERYIFPGSTLPTGSQLVESFKDYFLLEDWHNFGVDYDKTLMQWYRNFEAAWPRLAGNYSERFYRMWKYYLLACAASFRARKSQLWQLVLAPAEAERGYESVR